MSGAREPTGFFEFRTGREVISSLEPDADLVLSMMELASREGIEAGTFTAIGALKRARLAYYDQCNRAYREIEIDSPHEMASCLGNISIKDGRPFAHVHVVLADEAGNTKAGHLSEGIVFAAEVHLRSLEGPKLEREYDQASGLSLWKAE